MICETCGQIVIKHTKQQDVIDAVLTYFDVGFSYLKEKGRERRRVYPRQVLMYLLRKNTQLTLDDIALIFKGSDQDAARDHTCVIHSCKNIENLIFSDPVVREEITQIDKIIKRHNKVNEALMYKIIEQG